MRRDIEIHINTGDTTLSTPPKVTLRSFRWLEQPVGLEQRYLYGEVVLPSSLSDKTIVSQGIYVEIPYTPVYKEIRLRFRKEYGGELDSFVKNPENGTDWYVVQAGMYGNSPRNLYASELMAISEDTCFLSFDSGIVRLYSASQSDFNIVNANTQNKNLMLACIPGNNYRYPLTGVGLVRWANSKIDVSNLADILQKEFSQDGTPVKSASYNHTLRQLNLILDTSNIDNNGDI